MGYNQNSTFGYGNTGNGGGGGGGATNVEVIKVVAGDPGGPVPGETTYTNALMVGGSTDFIMVNNLPELDFGMIPAYTFDDVAGTIDRSPNTWGSGDTLFIQYRLPTT